ncbi:MAG: sulfite exporter TauE/SafE family protein [Paracoccaceae bacterium]
MFSLLLLFGAGFLAGCLNAVAGGGTFLTFPTLVYLGVPPVAANATATLAALPGYLGSAYGFRHDVSAEGTLGMRGVLTSSALGSVVGAALLLVTPSNVFSGIVPWLLLAATLLFAFGPNLLRGLRARGVGPAGPATSAAALFAVSVYGGYFNGGLGFLLLATFGLLGYVNLNGMNGLKTLIAALLSMISAVTFALAGLIAWKAAAIMAVATLLGGYAGASLARRVARTDLLRWGIVAVGAGMTIIFFSR